MPDITLEQIDTILDASAKGAKAIESLMAENERLRTILKKWVEYDDLGEGDFSEISPMFRYDEAISATRKALELESP